MPNYTPVEKLDPHMEDRLPHYGPEHYHIDGPAVLTKRPARPHFRCWMPLHECMNNVHHALRSRFLRAVPNGMEVSQQRYGN